MSGTMIVVAPCLLSPYFVYRGARGKDLAAARGVRELLGRHPGVEVLSYPCPEFILLGFPRPPATREVYERLGMREAAEKVATFIARVIGEEHPDRVVLLGVEGSPTCAARITTCGDPDAYPYHLLDEFRGLPKEERIHRARELSRDFRPARRPGILFELLRERVPGTYLDLDKDRLQESLAAFEKAITGAEAC